MTCTTPPALEDWMLLAYLDGDALDAVGAHLARCPDCRARALALARQHNRLTAQLYRLTCPSSHDLGEYHLGILDQVASEAIATHITECQHCREELAQLKAYLPAETVAPQAAPFERLQQQIKVLIATLVGEGNGAQPALAFAGLRGDEESASRIYQAGQAQIIIEIQEDTKPGRKALLGLVIQDSEPQNLEVQLWQSEHLQDTVTADAWGNFVVPAVAAGTYTLILKGSDLEIHIQDIEVTS